MIIRFNNNNIWEIIGNDKSVTCYRRKYGSFTNMVNVDKEINEEEMIPQGSGNSNFNYPNWKIFFGEEKLRKIANDPQEEQDALPLIYYCKYILGFNADHMMERVLPTRYIFEK